MKYALLSDVHGNLEAFEAVLKEIEKQSPEEILFLGDIVGYGANPNQSIELLKSITDTALAGNHDHAAAGLTDITCFNPYAKEAILWTQNCLTSDHLVYLKRLPYVLSKEEMTLVHASPKEPEQWHYLSGTGSIGNNFDCFDTRLCFIGHTHIPLVIIEEKGEVTSSSETSIEIEESKRYMINIGSVGQPRDGNNQAAYAIYDTKEGVIEIHRTSYDIRRAKEKIIKEGIPAYLADRLDYGR